MSDDRRPHRMSQGTHDAICDGAWIIAWTCVECGDAVREFGARDDSRCPIDWRGAST